MAIAWEQNVSPWAGNNVAGRTSALFTPLNAGDFILLSAATSDGINQALTATGTGTYTSENQTNATGSSTWAMFVNSNASNAANQTIVLNDTASGECLGVALIYSGVGSVTYAVNTVASPGLGAGAITGTTVLVPSGSILLAICGDANFNSPTISSTSGTNRVTTGSFPSYIATEYAGAGSNITPAFTTGANGTDTYVVQQWMLNLPVGSSPILMGGICL